MNIWGITDTGVVREQNQDYYHIELLEENVSRNGRGTAARTVEK